MPSPRKLCRSLGLLSVAAVAAAAAGLSGCTEAAPKAKPPFTALPPREVPAYLKDSVYEYTDMLGTEPYPVSGYGLITSLHGTGGSQAPTLVRDYMVKELARHRLDTSGDGYLSPDRILDSKNFSIVKVEGSIPPGARSGSWGATWFDVRVSALPQSGTVSLADGNLLECDLKIGGANPADPGNGQPEVKAQSEGAVFVDPTFVLDTALQTPAAKAARRTGLVLEGARAMEDRPLILRLRAPERRLARAVERRVNEQFQESADDDLQPHGNPAAKKVANAQNEAEIYVYVPRAYAASGHWEHFAGLVRHLYLQGDDPGFAALKARELATEATTDTKAPLLDISYAWEGLGKSALYAIDPLLTDPRDDVRFAAARAAAFIGDAAAVPVLVDIAATPGNAFRVNAVEALGELPPTPRVDALCRSLLDSDQRTVRTAAYQLLVAHRDPSIFTQVVTDGGKDLFALDVVRTTGRPGSGPPLIVASQRGVPRIAVFGTDTAVDLPVIFQTLEDRLMIATSADGERLAVSYRSPYRLGKLAEFQCRPYIPNLVAMLGGDGNQGGSATRFHLGYADVVAVVQALVNEQKVTGEVGGQRLAATFVLGEPAVPVLVPTQLGRPLLRGENNPAGRPAGDGAQPANPADNHGLIRAQSSAGAAAGSSPAVARR